MYRSVELRCIVQSKGASDKYYPKIISVRTTETFPWFAPAAYIEINTNVGVGTAGYMSPIRMDDIVRVQVNTRLSTDEKSVWQNIFEGRIMSVSATWGQDNITTLICRGHGEELLYRAITADYSASSARTGTILASLVGSYLTRLTNTTLIDTTASTVIPSFNIQQDTKFAVDAVKELEALEAYGYIFKVVTSYDSNDDLDTNVVSWQPVPSLSKTVQIIQGTPRLITADFSQSIENLLEDVTIYGASGTPQKIGTSIDGSPSYGTRYHIGTDTSILTDALCTSLATAIRSQFGSERGSVRILGDPNIDVGDLIYVRIPSLELEGSSIDGNYRVKRLSHYVSERGWYTDLDLGDLIETPEDILAGVHTKNRLVSANFID